MNIISVIPLTRSKVADTLSYFTVSEVPLGAIVTVPLRSKNIYGIVTEIRPAEDIKQEIKRAPFEIRKLGRVRATAFFPASFIESCRILSDYYATTPGAIIDTLVADTLLQSASRIAPPVTPEIDLWNNQRSARKSGEIFAVQGDMEDRMSSWRSLIRQQFARRKSVVIYVPTVEDVRLLFSTLEKGIEGYIFQLSGNLPSKKIVEVWKIIADTDHPIVVIATPSFSLLPRHDIEAVIIEKENGRGWITQRAPYLDFRHALEITNSALGRTIYLSDSLLRVETLHRLSEHEISEGSPFKWRSVSTARDTLVDMRTHKSDDGRFRVISPELEDLITRNRKDSTHLFIMTTRRGVAPSTVCDDCETIVTCSSCSAPVVLHTSGHTGKNFFMCHICGERRSAAETCVNCGSWKLTPLGIGIERVEEEILRIFPGIDLFKIDADSGTDARDTGEIFHKFKARPGSVLLGTEMALSYIPEKIEHVAIASLDSLFALPDFRIQEKIMYILTRLRSVAERSILLQTRRSEEKVLEYGLKGNLSDFYRTAADERRQFCYPPFSTLVKITVEGKKENIAKVMADIQKQLEPTELSVFPAFTASVRGNFIIHGLIKTELHSWPAMSLIPRLRSLPPSVKVKINPESLL